MSGLESHIDERRTVPGLGPGPAGDTPEAREEHHDHPPYLAHHWDTPQQQFEAGKLGMWLFLATEVLLFGGLFCGYAVWRTNNPDLFAYASQFLDTTMGAINTAVLILSSFTMAWAVTAAQRNQKGLMLTLLALTFAGAVGFLVIKYFEYNHKFHSNLYPTLKFYQPDSPDDLAHHSEYWLPGGDVANPAVGVGLAPAPAPAPGAGGDAAEAEAPAEAAAPADAPAAAAAPAPPRVDAPMPEQSLIPPAEIGPAGLAAGALEFIEAGEDPDTPVFTRLGEAAGAVQDIGTEVDDHHADTAGEAHPVHPLQDAGRPRNPHMFFNIYYMMTGLHGIHVVIGMIVIAWLFYRGARGHFSNEYFTPVDLGGLYWHVVDLIWIFLFPLFYLI